MSVIMSQIYDNATIQHLALPESHGHTGIPHTKGQ